MARLGDRSRSHPGPSNLFNTRIAYGKTGNKGFIGAFGVNYNITEGARSKKQEAQEGAKSCLIHARPQPIFAT